MKFSKMSEYQLYMLVMVIGVVVLYAIYRLTMKHKVITVTKKDSRIPYTGRAYKTKYYIHDENDTKYFLTRSKYNMVEVGRKYQISYWGKLTYSISSIKLV